MPSTWDWSFAEDDRDLWVDQRGGRHWRGTCPTDPSVIASLVFRHAGDDAKIGVETGSMTPWLVHGLREAGLAVDVWT
jgi:transposase